MKTALVHKITPKVMNSVCLMLQFDNQSIIFTQCVTLGCWRPPVVNINQHWLKKSARAHPVLNLLFMTEKVPKKARSSSCVVCRTFFVK